MKPKRPASKSVTINTEEDLANLVMQAPPDSPPPQEEKIDSVVPAGEAEERALDEKIATGATEFHRAFSVANAGDVSSQDIFSEFADLHLGGGGKD